MLENKHFTYIGYAYLRCYNVIPSEHYFYVKTKMLASALVYL